MSKKNDLISADDIQKQIYTFRNMQVMLDSDLAKLYGEEIRRLNEQVKRNKERFPPEFCFQLNEKEVESLENGTAVTNGSASLRSQIAILKNKRGKHRKFLPYAFTEQGVAMLSAVLRSETAIRVSVQIMNAFVVMRRFLISNAQIFQRLNTLEVKQVHTDKKIDQVLSALEDKSIQPKQGIFYNGQVFDAWSFVSNLVRSAKKSIAIIDNYVVD